MTDAMSLTKGAGTKRMVSKSDFQMNSSQEEKIRKLLMFAPGFRKAKGFCAVSATSGCVIHSV